MTRPPITQGVLLLAPLLLLALAFAAACSSAEQQAANPAPAAVSAIPTPTASAVQRTAEYSETDKPLSSLGAAHRAARGLPASPGASGQTSGGGEMEVTVILARFSTSDAGQSERRESAARELSDRFDDGDLDEDRALSLLDTIAPGASIDARKKAARRLAALSAERGRSGAERGAEAANEVARLITGHGIDAERRIGAARALATGIKNGGMDANRALGLMNAIAPETSVETRARALKSLATDFRGGDWDDEKLSDFSEQLHRATFGHDLNYEERAGAAIDLTGEGIKRFGGDSYDDEDIDTAGELIKGVIGGDLDVQTVSDIMDRN